MITFMGSWSRKNDSKSFSFGCVQTIPRSIKPSCTLMPTFLEPCSYKSSSICGYSCLKAPNRLAKTGAPVIGGRPISTVPCSNLNSFSKSVFKCSNIKTTRLACVRKIAPASVSSTALALRIKRTTPNSSSNALIVRLMAD